MLYNYKKLQNPVEIKLKPLSPHWNNVHLHNDTILSTILSTSQ